ncbi:hypothetical protein SSPO_032940 [Streptomyces antimycoticus]|uniref:Uncharacterized protein n=1 Tax=Streptomyces antimycoticus TaxID=68175 RepID=A0A499UVW9_9ACTN|nr:hypothetical protein SSPO_032940 [Streptomyces antimycoticus]
MERTVLCDRPVRIGPKLSRITLVSIPVCMTNKYPVVTRMGRQGQPGNDQRQAPPTPLMRHADDASHAAPPHRPR